MFHMGCLQIQITGDNSNPSTLPSVFSAQTTLNSAEFTQLSHPMCSLISVFRAEKNCLYPSRPMIHSPEGEGCGGMKALIKFL